MIEKLPLPVRWDEAENCLLLLDQRVLPLETRMVAVRTVEETRTAIADMTVRGAPAIGVTAAYGMALCAAGLPDDEEAFFSGLRKGADLLISARPTAVNLSWAVETVWREASAHRSEGVPALKKRILDCARRLHREDGEVNRAIGESLLPRMREGMGVLTHCNAGHLATTLYGTALSPIYLAMEKGLHIRVYSDETRPRLQGSTLTAWELTQAGADVTVICDDMAATVMSQGKVDCCIVGCDRVAINGDTANKIGTMGVAILARFFGIPFYVAAPLSTIDPACPDGSGIPIEERDPSEVTCRFGRRTAPEGVKVYNPGFDVTPHRLITAFATEKGLVTPPFEENFRRLLGV